MAQILKSEHKLQNYLILKDEPIYIYEYSNKSIALQNLKLSIYTVYYDLGTPRKSMKVKTFSKQFQEKSKSLETFLKARFDFI